MCHSSMHRFLFLLIVGFYIFIYSDLSIGHNRSHPSPLPSQIATKIFWALNDALAQYEKAQQHPWPIIPDQPRILKIGTHTESILLLRQRLKLTGDLAPENDIERKLFDADLADAVKNFQIRHGLKADGVIGQGTRDALNVPPEQRAKQIALNMQRWANLATQLGNRFVMVNIPDFHMYLIDDNKTVLTLRAIVGKRELPTPEIASKITTIEFNPDWDIPEKIAQNDIAPKMLEDPDYLDRMNIRVYRTTNSSTPINPRRVNWESAAEYGLNFHLRQDSGPENALGLVKFQFQNEQDVYMHDTPAKNLFDVDTRDFSHGCIRLENPFSLVEYLLREDPNWSNERLQSILETKKPNYVKLRNPIPIFITYLTAWVDREGRVNFRDDIYQQDE